MKMNPKLRKALTLILCAMTLVAISVGATVAYLTDIDDVTNTFTVGHVDITLDEADVKTDGTYETDVNARVQVNAYHLLPGHEYIKDPTVHVTAESEPSWIFVKIENEIAAIEAETTIAQQILNNGWTQLKDKDGNAVEGVYYRAHDKSAKDYVVFERFTIDGEVTTDELAEYAEKTIKVTAYAIQMDGFNDEDKEDIVNALAAWEAGVNDPWTTYPSQDEGNDEEPEVTPEG